MEVVVAVCSAGTYECATVNEIKSKGVVRRTNIGITWRTTMIYRCKCVQKIKVRTPAKSIIFDKRGTGMQITPPSPLAMSSLAHGMSTNGSSDEVVVGQGL